MLIHSPSLGPLLFIPVALGLLLLFGKKKKEEKDDAKSGQAPSSVQAPPDHGLGTNPPTARPLGYITASSQSSYPSMTEEESPLNKLLHSLMQEIPYTSSAEQDQNTSRPQSTSDYVPLRATPPSRAMVIVPGDKGQKILEPLEPRGPTSQVKTPRPPEQLGPPSGGAREPEPGATLKPSGSTEDEVRKSGRLEKLEKEAKAEPRAAARRATQGFDHLFDLTQGALRTPGLVVVTGPQASGKSTLCQSLAGSYLKQGNPCLFAAYDKPASAVRDGMKSLGFDVAEFESQYRFLIVDCYSGQSEAFSLEPYYVEKPLDLDNVQDTLVRNCQVFLGERVGVILDSLDLVASKMPVKEFVSKFRELATKMRESGVVFVVTLDSGKSKDLLNSLTEMADCVIVLEKEGATEGKLKVRKLNGSEQKAEPRLFEIDSSKGMLFASGDSGFR